MIAHCFRKEGLFYYVFSKRVKFADSPEGDAWVRSPVSASESHLSGFVSSLQAFALDALRRMVHANIFVA